MSSNSKAYNKEVFGLLNVFRNNIKHSLDTIISKYRHGALSSNDAIIEIKELFRSALAEAEEAEQHAIRLKRIADVCNMFEPDE